MNRATINAEVPTKNISRSRMLFEVILATRYLGMSFWNAIPCTRKRLERLHTANWEVIHQARTVCDQRRVHGGSNTRMEL